MTMGALTNLPLKDQIAEILRREIAAGNMADGEELTQEGISTALAVSRIPVREAFLQLESEGLLRRLPNRHVQVVGLTAERRRQNLISLEALEITLGKLLSENWKTEAALNAFSQCRTASDREAMQKADNAFHLALSSGLNNPTLQQLHMMSRRGLFANNAISMDTDTLLSLNEAIAQALESQDADALSRGIHIYYQAFLQ